MVSNDIEKLEGKYFMLYFKQSVGQGNRDYYLKTNQSTGIGQLNENQRLAVLSSDPGREHVFILRKMDDGYCLVEFRYGYGELTTKDLNRYKYPYLFQDDDGNRHSLIQPDETVALFDMTEKSGMPLDLIYDEFENRLEIYIKHRPQAFKPTTGALQGGKNLPLTNNNIVKFDYYNNKSPIILKVKIVDKPENAVEVAPTDTPQKISQSEKKEVINYGLDQPIYIIPHKLEKKIDSANLKFNYDSNVEKRMNQHLARAIAHSLELDEDRRIGALHNLTSQVLRKPIDPRKDF